MRENAFKSPPAQRVDIILNEEVKYNSVTPVAVSKAQLHIISSTNVINAFD